MFLISSILIGAKCCTIFSVTGIIFLLVIGILLQKQPLYIKGVQDPAMGAAGCYQGAAIYFATFVISLGYWMFDDFTKGIGFFASRGAKLREGHQKMKVGSKYGSASTN